MSNFLSEKELAELGLKAYGKNVLIGRHVVLYSLGQLTLGDNVRIDDFTIITQLSQHVTDRRFFVNQGVS